MSMRIDFTASDDVRSAIARLGRTEDAQFSPSQQRLVIAGYAEHRLLVLDADIGVGGVALDNPVELRSQALNHPHGVTWVNEQTLIVANRDGEVTIFELPANTGGIAQLDPVRSFGKALIDQIETPGSVSVYPVGLGLIEVLVANNYANTISRHLLDQRDKYAVVSSEILLAKGLDVPDGVVHSPSGRWIAVCSHNSRSVFTFRNDGSLSPDSTPDGTMPVACPHGVRFAQDERTLLITDASAPIVHVFKSDDGDWSGQRSPGTQLRVLDEEIFVRGRHNAEEGGPKGLDITRDGTVMVTSCEEMPLSFFDVRSVLNQIEPAPQWPTNLSETDRARDALLRVVSSGRATAEAKLHAVDEAHRLALDALLATRSWRLTAPLRRVTTMMRGLLRRTSGV